MQPCHKTTLFGYPVINFNYFLCFFFLFAVISSTPQQKENPAYFSKTDCQNVTLGKAESAQNACFCVFSKGTKAVINLSLIGIYICIICHTIPSLCKAHYIN